MIGRVEEWMKPICQKHKCKYYSHHDYPNCSYCVAPDGYCVIYAKDRKEGDEK